MTVTPVRRVTPTETPTGPLRPAPPPTIRVESCTTGVVPLLVGSGDVELDVLIRAPRVASRVLRQLLGRTASGTRAASSDRQPPSWIQSIGGWRSSAVRRPNACEWTWRSCVRRRLHPFLASVYCRQHFAWSSCAERRLHSRHQGMRFISRILNVVVGLTTRSPPLLPSDSTQE